MPRYPGYRFASEFHRHERPVDTGTETAFLRIFPDERGYMRAGLYPTPKPEQEDDWPHGETLTDQGDALNAASEHPHDRTLQEERLLIAAYARLNHDRSRTLNVYVPTSLRPWAARFQIETQHILLYVTARTDTGARYAASETARLTIRDQADASFKRVE